MLHLGGMIRFSACFKNADEKKELLNCQGLYVSACPFLQEGMFSSLEGCLCLTSLREGHLTEDVV